MTYKYYLPSLSPPTTASAILVENFQALISEQFAVATDIFTIQEEYVFASGSYVTLQVRVNGAIDQITGEKLGDDFKTFLFEDASHPIDMGRKFIFDNNYWITYNTEKTKNLAASCTVRRCNNVLRWSGSDGTIYQEPCSIEYKTNNPRNNLTKDSYITPGGYMAIYCQLNDFTKNIKEGQRFLFGNPTNWVCFKVFGGGIRNYSNLKTSDNTSAQLLKVEAETNFVNEEYDDLLLGIADKYLYATSASIVGSISILPASGDILESGSANFNAIYYSGSVATSSSFVFSINDNYVPTDHYTFSIIDGNNFVVTNNERYFDYPLSVLCQTGSGSRVFEISLRGAW